MKYLLQIYYILRLFVLFLYDLTISSVEVAKVALAPRDLARPRFVVVELDDDRSDVEITLIANYNTLTPGSVTLDVSPDRRRLFIHSLLAGESSDGPRTYVRDRIEPRVLKATRS